MPRALGKALLLTFMILTLSAPPVRAQTKNEYLKIIRTATEYNLKESDNIIARWKSSIQKSNLFGYSTTSYPANFAELLGFMYQKTGDDRYAKKAAEMLLIYEELKQLFPKEFYVDRVEFAKGLPPISDFFSMYSYPKAYLYIKKSRRLAANDRQIIERGIADCANFLLNNPEWGPMNRALLRAETFLYATQALPDHPDAGKWRQMAKALASDSYQRWEEEDATSYHAIWMLALMRFVEAADDKAFYRSAVPRYYLDYFTHLITPAGLLADFGDAQWPSDWYRFLAIFEKGAAEYREPLFKWAARQILGFIQQNELSLNGAYTALAFVEAYRWADESIRPEAPPPESRLVMEDVIGKKVVFRDGTESNSTFLLLNYRDEGEGAFAGREFLRTTIPAEEEKTHHGHADENSIVSLFFEGAILLHDSGYRDKLPSGEYGRFRADYFHNRVVTRKNMRWRQLEGERQEQPLWEFLRNSGAYRPVQTRLINFLTFERVDFATTRLTDDEMGYEWDRTLIFHKPDRFFIVVDAIKALRDDFFTHANLWHTRKIVATGERWFDTRIDSIGGYANRGDNNLLIYFPGKEVGRSHGQFEIERHWQQEIALYETVSEHYYANDLEVFVTVLFPHPRALAPGELAARFELIATDKFPSAVGLKYAHGGRIEYFGVKTDLKMDYIPQNLRPRYAYDRGKVDYGPFQTDASFLYGAIAGNKVRYAAANMVKVRYENRVLHESPEMSFGLQLDGAPPRAGRVKWRSWEEEVE